MAVRAALISPAALRKSLRRSLRRRAVPLLLLWILLLFMLLAEALPVVMRDCASLTWAG